MDTISVIRTSSDEELAELHRRLEQTRLPDEVVGVGCRGADRLPDRPTRGLALYDVRRWTRLDRGGHFLAFEEPEAFVRDVREFCATLA